MSFRPEARPSPASPSERQSPVSDRYEVGTLSSGSDRFHTSLPDSGPMLIKTFRVVAGPVLALAVLAGCSGPATDERSPDIATLRTAAPGPSAPPSAAARERPVIRPDEGRVEFERYLATWRECLYAEGVPRDGNRKPRPGPVTDAATTKCAHLYPENWMEREARTNPEYVDRLRETAKCLVKKGHQVTVGGDPVSLMYGDNTSANEAYDDEQECQREAFREEVRKYEGG